MAWGEEGPQSDGTQSRGSDSPDVGGVLSQEQCEHHRKSLSVSDAAETRTKTKTYHSRVYNDDA